MLVEFEDGPQTVEYLHYYVI